MSTAITPFQFLLQLQKEYDPFFAANCFYDLTQLPSRLGLTSNDPICKQAVAFAWARDQQLKAPLPEKVYDTKIDLTKIRLLIDTYAAFQNIRPAPKPICMVHKPNYHCGDFLRVASLAAVGLVSFVITYTAQSYLLSNQMH